MIEIPLKNGLAFLHFVEKRKWPRKENILPAKIDTGARFLMIPEKNRTFFTSQFTGKSMKFCSASGDGFEGREAKIIANIKNLGVFHLRAYYYHGNRILFGISEFTRYFSFCLDREKMYVWTDGEKFPCG